MNVKPDFEILARVFGETIMEGLSSGQSVRICGIGLWTPYTDGGGRSHIAFQQDASILKHRKSNTVELNDTIPMKNTPTETKEKRKTQEHGVSRRMPQPVDVPLLFDEVKREFGFKATVIEHDDTSVVQPVLEQNLSDDEATAVISESQPPQPSATNGGQPSATNGGQPSATNGGQPSVASAESPPEPAIQDILEEESAAVFQRNREQLFHPPAQRKRSKVAKQTESQPTMDRHSAETKTGNESRGLRKVAFMLTLVVAVIVVYLLYSGGLFNGILPVDWQYRHAPQLRSNRAASDVSSFHQIVS